MKWKERGMVSMINKDYFKYLIKQNKKYLILIYLVGIIIPFWVFNEYTPSLDLTGTLSLVYGLGLSCIVPIYLFSFLQKKKSNILYFSLPIKKESLYLTTSLFSYFATILPVVIYQLIAQGIFAYKMGISIGAFILAIIITIVHMFAMNTLITTITLLTQNSVDNFICSFAYIFLPLLIYIALNNCATNIVYKMMLGEGNYTQGLNAILYYLSIPYNGLAQMKYIELHVTHISSIYWLIISLVLSFVNYRLFIKRTVEQSESHTKSFFMYPSIIILGTFAMLLVMYTTDFKSNVLSFTIIFMIYLIMYYFSKRKVYFNWKIPTILILLVVSCIGFSSIYANTKGFHSIYEVPSTSSIRSASFSFSFMTNYETKTELKYKGIDVTDINYSTGPKKSSKDNTNFVNFINDIINQKLITKYDDFYNDPINKNFYTIGVYYSIQSPTDLGRYASRDYVIEEKNIEKVLDLVAKYNLYKFKS